MAEVFVNNTARYRSRTLSDSRQDADQPWRLKLFTFCWHDFCNAMTGGEHMSYKGTIRTNRRQFERQQEKLRIAREALARVEAKYARKRHEKQLVESPAKMRAQRPRPER
jgi:hypothetical protein